MPQGGKHFDLTRMAHSGHERSAFAAMHGFDLLYLSLRSLALGKAHEAGEFITLIVRGATAGPL